METLKTLSSLITGITTYTIIIHNNDVIKGTGIHIESTEK